MRPILCLLALLLAGCADSLSCERLDALQATDAARTCVASASLEGAPAAVALTGASPLMIDGPPSRSATWTFDDGVRLSLSRGVLSWSSGRGVVRRDSLGAMAGAVAAPVGERYAVALGDGRLLLRSRGGADPVDLPIEIETIRIGDWEHPRDVRLAFSADGRRLAAADARRRPFVVDAGTGERLWEAALDTTARAVALSADGARVAVAATDRTVAVWDVASGARVGAWVHPRAVGDVAFAPGGADLLVWLDERTSTRRQRTGRPGSSSRSTTVSRTTPPAVVVWRLP